MKLLKEYHKIEQEIFSYFEYKGYSEGICDYTDQYWNVDNGNISWGPELPIDEEYLYSEEVYHNNIFIKEEWTMIFIRCDYGGRYFGIFDNSKRIEEDKE